MNQKATECSEPLCTLPWEKESPQCGKKFCQNHITAVSKAAREPYCVDKWENGTLTKTLTTNLKNHLCDKFKDRPISKKPSPFANIFELFKGKDILYEKFLYTTIQFSLTYTWNEKILPGDFDVPPEEKGKWMKKTRVDIRWHKKVEELKTLIKTKLEKILDDNKLPAQYDVTLYFFWTAQRKKNDISVRASPHITSNKERIIFDPQKTIAPKELLNLKRNKVFNEIKKTFEKEFDEFNYEKQQYIEIDGQDPKYVTFQDKTITITAQETKLLTLFQDYPEEYKKITGKGHTYDTSSI